METITMVLPQHWACALINADDTGLDDKEQAALDAFSEDMLQEYGCCLAIDCDDDPQFMKYHDAQMYGVLACDCIEYTFDITKR